MSEFNCFIGVDQTGSVNSSGFPQPLPVFAIVSVKNKWRVIQTSSSPGRIKKFQYSFFEEFFRDSQLGDLKHWNCLILVDCVLGLPNIFAEPQTPALEQLQSLMRQASQTSHWGLAAGHEFFSGLLRQRKLSAPPKRKCEIDLKANSVFTHQPFQKNIQTGSFRIWKDLGGDPESLKQFVFCPFESHLSFAQRPILAEGYPSLAWQTLGGGKRNSQSLQTIIDRFKTQIDDLEALLQLDKDTLDAALLALWGWFTMQQGYEPQLNPNSLEGFIWGQNFKLQIKTSQAL